MSESSLDNANIGSKPSIYEELSHIEPVTRVEVKSEKVSTLGIVTGVWGGIGDSAIAAKAVEGGVKMALIDGVGNDETQVLTPERIHAEIVAKAILEKPIMSGLSLAEAQLRQINKNGLGPRTVSVSNDPLYCMMAFAEIAQKDGQFFVEPIAVGDVSILALVPDAEGKFDSSSLRFLYFNPFADRSQDSILTPRFHAVRENELCAPNPSIFPTGSIIIMADDGGMDAILNPRILLEAGSSFSRGSLLNSSYDFERMISEQNKGKYSMTELHAQLAQSLNPLMELFNLKGHHGASSALFNSLISQPKVINDDAALLITEVGGGKV